jgi:hypothetical protein
MFAASIHDYVSLAGKRIHLSGLGRKVLGVIWCARRWVVGAQAAGAVEGFFGSTDRATLATGYRGSRFRAAAPRPCSPVSCWAAAVPVTGTGEPL